MSPHFPGWRIFLCGDYSGQAAPGVRRALLDGGVPQKLRHRPRRVRAAAGAAAQGGRGEAQPRAVLAGGWEAAAHDPAAVRGPVLAGAQRRAGAEELRAELAVEGAVHEGGGGQPRPGEPGRGRGPRVWLRDAPVGPDVSDGVAVGGPQRQEVVDDGGGVRYDPELGGVPARARSPRARARTRLEMRACARARPARKRFSPKRAHAHRDSSARSRPRELRARDNKADPCAPRKEGRHTNLLQIRTQLKKGREETSSASIDRFCSQPCSCLTASGTGIPPSAEKVRRARLRPALDGPLHRLAEGNGRVQS